MRGTVLVTALALCASRALGGTLDTESINQATVEERSLKRNEIDPAMIRLQVALDRARFSPGEIDGKSGENVDKAIAAFRHVRGLSSTSVTELWSALNEASAQPAVVEYRISDSDLKGPFVDKIPSKMDEQTDLAALAYTGPKEQLAERFHMSQQLLVALNPDTKFDKAGETIRVANVTNENHSKSISPRSR